MEELVAYIARALVDKPELVELRSSVVEGQKLYELKVAPEDIGKIIGRDGRTVNAIRSLLALAAARKGEKARLEILDDRRAAPQAGAASPAEPPPPEP